MEMSLKNREWKEFKIGDIFNVGTGANVPKKYLKKGNIPRISATEQNNGIVEFTEKSNHKNFRTNINFISVSFLGAVFYHKLTASLDMKIHTVQLKNRVFNKYLAEFIVHTLKRSVGNTSYGNQVSSTDLPNKKVFLPINSQGEPDYEFMEAYMRAKEQEKINAYKNYISKRIKELENAKPVVSLKEKDWAEFEINKIFQIKSGKRLTKADMKKGKKPFIGSTDNNNGITEYVSNTNSSEDYNVLGVNYNGSVVENFYHPYKALFSDDVKRLSFKEVEGNKYLYLFAKTLILKQKSKYQYGYKFNGKRMNRQKIMLPINEKKEPDYEYMENYIKRLELEKIKKYLDYKETK